MNDEQIAEKIVQIVDEIYDGGQRKLRKLFLEGMEAATVRAGCTHAAAIVVAAIVKELGYKQA